MDTVTYTPEDVWAGGHPETVAETIAADEVLPAMTPLGRVAATGLLVAWDPAAVDGSEKAVRLNAFAIDATGAAAEKEVVFAGMPISAAINWPDGTTAAQKLCCFDGSQIVLGTLAP